MILQCIIGFQSRSIDSTNAFDQAVLKSQRHDPDIPNYMEALSGENTDKYFKAMCDEIQGLMRRDTWEIISRKSVADQNLIPETWSFK